MQYTIREMRKDEYPMLQDFLYEAIFIPKGTKPPLKTILATPELQTYIYAFGSSTHDKAFVAEVEGMVVGAIWVRIMQDYGHICDEIPSLAMSVYHAYRGMGIGSALLANLISTLRLHGYSNLSLSVQKANEAVRLYRRYGFRIFKENCNEYIMLLDLKT